MTLEQAASRLIDLAFDYDQQQEHACDIGYWDGFVQHCEVNGVIVEAADVLMILVKHWRANRQSLQESDFINGDMWKYQDEQITKRLGATHATD